MASPFILKVFLRDHVWAFLLIFGKFRIGDACHVIDRCSCFIAISLFATLTYELTDYLGEVALT